MRRIDFVIKNYRCFSDSEPARFSLGNNIVALLGRNNSGKSSLLKFFYEFRNAFSSLARLEPLRGILRGAETPLSFPAEVFDQEEIFHNQNERPIEIDIFDESISHTGSPVHLRLTFTRSPARFKLAIVAGGVLEHDKLSLSVDVQSITYERQPIAHVERFLSLFKDLSRCIYVGPFRNAFNAYFTITQANHYNEHSILQRMQAKYYDMHVGLGLIKHWRETKTGPNKKVAAIAYKIIDDLRTIFDFQRLDINSESGDRSVQLNIDGSIYALHELGAGLSQFFLVLANVAPAQPSWALIDEPELNLHPALQLDLLTTVAKYCANGTVFATHSIGLARSSADAIYVVHKDEQSSRVLRYEKVSSLAEMLGELSFSTYRELGFDRILLVEGSTEVKTIQQFLRKLRKDHEILLIPLGGAGLINAKAEPELQEIKRITHRVFALIDSEKSAADAKLDVSRQGFVETCARLDIRCHVLENRATENYFPQAAITRALGSSYAALGPYEKLAKTANGWAKADNWKIASEMSLDELVATDLGVFLKEVCGT